MICFACSYHIWFYRQVHRAVILVSILYGNTSVVWLSDFKNPHTELRSTAMSKCTQHGEKNKMFQILQHSFPVTQNHCILGICRYFQRFSFLKCDCKVWSFCHIICQLQLSSEFIWHSNSYKAMQSQPIATKQCSLEHLGVLRLT